MTIKKIVETQVVGHFRGWQYGRAIPLQDGSSWQLDESSLGREYNKQAQLGKEKIGTWSNREAVILKGKERFFLKVEGKGKRRQVVPVHLPDPQRYDTPLETKRRKRR